MPALDPLDDSTPLDRSGVPRDRWGRALLYRADGWGPVPYTSASTLAKEIQSTHGLQLWQTRMKIKGTGMDAELSALAGSSTYSTGLGERDAGRNKEEGRILDEVGERALERAKAHQRRDFGSALHRFMEQGDDVLADVPEYMQLHVEAIQRSMDRLRIKPVVRELFVANDRLMSAGSFDLLAEVPWRKKLVLIDLKSGRINIDADQVQLAVYEGGDPYEVDDDGNHLRTTYADQGWDVDPDYGIRLQVSADPDEHGRVEAEWWPLDLEEGRIGARIAIEARDYRKRHTMTKKKQPLDTDLLMEDHVRSLIDAMETPTKAVMKELYREFKDVWTDDLMSYGWKAIRERGQG